MNKLNQLLMAGLILLGAANVSAEDRNNVLKVYWMTSKPGIKSKQVKT